MITLRVWFLAIATIMALAAGAWSAFTRPGPAMRPAMSTSTVDGAPSKSRSYAGRTSSLGANPDTLGKLLRQTESHFDVYGNEIEDAVTDYRIDPAGDVYERHSPETEVPRLGPPLI